VAYKWRYINLRYLKMSNNEQELKKLESEMDRIESDSLSFPYDPLGNAIDTAIQSHIEEDGFQEEVIDYETVEMINKIQKSLDVIEKEANHLGSISHMAEGARSILRHYINPETIVAEETPSFAWLDEIAKELQDNIYHYFIEDVVDSFDKIKAHLTNKQI